MADRREPPKPGTPEYRWLYGDPDETRATDTGGGKKRPLPQSDETRVMPVVLPPERPRQQRQAPSRPTAYQPPAPPASPPRRPVSPPPGSSPSGRPPQAYRKPRRIKRWILLAVAAWMVFLVITPISALSKIDSVDAFPSGSRPADQPGTTYLIVGTDKADGLTRAQKKVVRAGNRTSARTDTIMLLHTGSGPSTLISIPRDSPVPIPGHGTSKINAAYAWGGSKLLVQTIEQNTGIRIDHVVEIGFGGLVAVVDAVGGVTICPKKRMDDKDARLHIKKGCQEVDGLTALAYSRSRHAQQYGDFERSKHQQEVIGAIGHKVLSPWTVINPFRYWRTAHAGARNLTVSQGTGTYALIQFARAMANPDKRCGVPVAGWSAQWDSTRAPRLFNLIKTDRTENITASLCNGLPR
jgi:LCP family protein required for cell wall assembly